MSLKGNDSLASGLPQQLICDELLVLEDRRAPSLFVIEQLSLLTRDTLDACTEPTSDIEIGVTVNDHGRPTFRCVRLRPDASTKVTVMTETDTSAPPVSVDGSAQQTWP